MQEIRYDGSQRLTDRATKEQVLEALGDPTNKTVVLHKPGSAVKLPNGDEYVAQADGSWARVKSPTELHAEALQRRIEAEQEKSR